jgi:hypothetical protein
MEKCIAIQVTRFAEFHDFGNRRETTLDLKHQKLETERGEITRAAPTLDLYRCLYVHELDYPSYAIMYICFLYRENHFLGMGN